MDERPQFGLTLQRSHSGLSFSGPESPIFLKQPEWRPDIDKVIWIFPYQKIPSRLKMESRSSIFSASYVPNASISLPVVITVEDVADVSANGSVLEAVFLGEHYPIVSCRSESLNSG